MRLVRRLAVWLVVSLFGLAVLWSEAAMANTNVMTVYHTDTTFAVHDWCEFPVHFHIAGSYKGVDYFDDGGFLYKTIYTAGGGSSYRWTASANGKALTMQMQSFMQVITYGTDGSATSAIHGVDLKFTYRGSGIVLQDVGTVFTDENGGITFTAGPHQSLSEDFEEFCAVLS
jgi:opacity protein-like surface antigen